MADERAQLTGEVQPIPEGYRWADLAGPQMEGVELEQHYRETLRVLGTQDGMLGLIFEKAQNKIQDPAKLRQLIVELIGKENWSAMSADVKGDAYEGLLEKNAQDVKGGAGQYFTPRALIEAIVDCVQPRPGEVVVDPACGTGGFLLAKTITVGKAKTPSGDGRVIPLNQTAARVLSTWVKQFPGRTPEHYVFPRERVGFSGTDGMSQVYGTDPTTPITSWKVSWTSARKVAGVWCRFHDLRHTCITRLLERGVPLAVVASLMGWSPATTARMAQRYAHFGDSAQRRAMETLDPPAAPASTASGEQEKVQ